MAINGELLDKLACPKCHGPLEMIGDEKGLACRTCDLLYEIKEGIPVMIVELALPLSSTAPTLSST